MIQEHFLILLRAHSAEGIMKLSTPKNVTFYVAVALALIALIGYFVASMSAFAPWLMFVAFLILAAGNFFEGL